MATRPDLPDTFPELLRRLLASDPGRPLVTAYDDASGERTELSVTTYANWVAKTANLLTDEYLLDPGDTVRLALPAHWLVPVFLGAAWTAGLTVTADENVPAELVITGPEPAAIEGPQLACALLPFAVRFPAALPDGVDDYGLLWPGQADVYAGSGEVDATTTACRHSGDEHAQAELLARAWSESASWSGRRLLTDLHPLTDCATTSFLAALVRDGSLVLVTHPDAERWPARLEDERATDVLRSI